MELPTASVQQHVPVKLLIITKLFQLCDGWPIIVAPSPVRQLGLCCHANGLGYHHLSVFIDIGDGNPVMAICNLGPNIVKAMG